MSGAAALLRDVPRLSISRHQHIALSKQQAAARDPETPDLASRHPSVNGADLYSAQVRDFALRQELFAREVFIPHRRLRAEGHQASLRPEPLQAHFSSFEFLLRPSAVRRPPAELRTLGADRL